ncbi:MAG: flagellar export protein FliJ [Pseudobutyrivibrio sp.]|nr:flagellar export protein FliJ [Pseudobutyrivibrio sp.]
MARFNYRMQNILDIKLKLEEQEKANFGLASARVNEEQVKLQQLMIRRASYEKQLKELSQGDICIRDIRICKSSIDAMKVAIRAQMIEVSKAQKQLEIVRKRLNDVMMERKMHEKLRQKAFEQFVAEVNREESIINDELVSYTYAMSEEQE